MTEIDNSTCPPNLFKGGCSTIIVYTHSAPSSTPPPPWYVHYAPELAVVAILVSLGVAMYLSPRFREAVERAFKRLSDF